MFGWNLQSRQEIHEQGEAYGRSSFLSDSTYVVKTKVSQYVKLHFVRALNSPNLDQIKQIEDQYFTLPFPEFPAPKSFLWPLFFILCAIISISNPEADNAIGGFIACGAIGILWLYFKIKQRQNSLATCMESIKRQEELLNQLQSLG